MLALAGAVEYVAPPFPGDTVTLFGVALAHGSGYALWLVYGAVTLGSIGGSLVAYSFGAWLGHHEERWPGFLRRDPTRRRIHTLVERFGRHGGAYLAVNRFLPAFRAVFFVAAGMAELPLWKVVVFGGLSAAAWNAGILVVGSVVGASFETLERVYDQYTWWAFAALGIVVLLAVLRWLWQTRRARTQ